MIELLDILETLVAPPFTITSDVDLPCIDLPMTVEIAAALRSVDEVQSPLALMEDAREEMIAPLVATLSFSDLNASERARILAAWDDGLGCVTPFYFTLPGDLAGARRWVFRDDSLNLQRTSAAAGDVQITLLEVPAPSFSK